MGNRLQKDIEFSGKSYKKEVAKIFVVNFLLALSELIIFFYFRLSIYLLIPLVIACIFNFFIISSYSNRKRMIQEERNEEFVNLISYFQIFINNGINVYNCFRMLVPYASPWMADELNNLIEGIDRDKTVQPYIIFASKFTLPIINNVMVSIFQMVDLGESNEQLNQFSFFFSDLFKNTLKNNVESKERSYSTVDSYPLIGTGFSTILITICVLMLMEEMINVF